MTQLPVFHNRFSRARSRDGGMPNTDVWSYCVLLHCCELTWWRYTDTFSCLVLVEEVLAVVITWDPCVLRLSFASRIFNYFFWSAAPCCVPWLARQSSCIPYSLWPLSSSCLLPLTSVSSVHLLRGLSRFLVLSTVSVALLAFFEVAIF